MLFLLPGARSLAPALALATLVLPCAAARAAEARSEAVRSLIEREARSRLSLMTQPDGKRTLVVKYPWKAHERTSVELRLVTAAKEPAGRAMPLYVAGQYFKGDVLVTVYRCLDRAAEVPNAAWFARDDKVFRVIGDRNSLGRPAVSVVYQQPEGDPLPGVSFTYPWLDNWAVDDNLLQLDLPREQFSEPGTLHVWFMRGDRVLWAAELRWPGYPK